jgi:hypothetical protein
VEDVLRLLEILVLCVDTKSSSSTSTYSTKKINNNREKWEKNEFFITRNAKTIREWTRQEEINTTVHKECKEAHKTRDRVTFNERYNVGLIYYRAYNRGEFRRKVEKKNN